MSHPTSNAHEASHASQSAKPSCFDVLAIGTSAGGLAALQKLFLLLPRPLPWAGIVVQHLHPDYKTYLPSILDRIAPFSVREATEGAVLEANIFYTAPSSHHLTVSPDRTLHLNHNPKEHFSRPSIDVLFRSVAESFGERAIAILLTGANTDGAEGIKQIKQKGGVTIAQDPATASSPRMPQAAIDIKAVDWVLSIEEIADKLSELIREDG